MVSNHYLTVQQWNPTVDWEHESVKRVVVWIHITDLPLPCFNKEFSTEVEIYFGRMLRIDETTFKATRCKFARISVKVDLEEPQESKFELWDQLFIVKYEGICFPCGKYDLK